MRVRALAALFFFAACRTYTVTYTDDGGTCDTNTHLVCNNVCVDPATDLQNCGGCGSACTTGQLCVAAACVSCPSGEDLVCGGGAPFCTDSKTDNDNCGACGVACAPGTSCSAGSCACPLTICEADCVDLQSDIAHCGACSTPCPTPAANEVALCSAGQCGAACVAPFADCDGVGSNGCESNLQTDSVTCGQCKRTCINGGSCTAGQCPVTEYASGMLTALAVDSSFVYWADSTGVEKAPIAGGAAQSVFFDGRVNHLAVDPTNVYLSDTSTGDAGTNGNVLAIPILGGGPTSLATSSGGNDLAVFGNYVYFVTMGGKVARAPTDGSSNATTLTNSATAIALAVDGTNVYFVTASGNLFFVPVGSISATPEPFAMPGNAVALAVDSSNVYWLAAGSVAVQAKSATSALTLASAQGSPMAIATDGVAVYWSTADAIRKVAVSGGTIATLVTGQTAPTSFIAVDAARVYWVSFDAVRSTTK